jgi:hypothetical protein
VVHPGPLADHGVRGGWLPPQLPGDQFPDLLAAQVPPVEVDTHSEIGPFLSGELCDYDPGTIQAVLLGNGQTQLAIKYLAVLGLDDRDDDAPVQDIVGQASA